VVSLLLGTSSRALAREPAAARFELEWDAPEGCLDREAARNAIADALGAASATVAAHAVVRVRITQGEDGRFSADIWMYDDAGGGERSFEGASCAQVAQATTLIVAMALASTRAADAAATPQALEPEHAATPAQQLRADRVRFGAGVHAQADIGSLPQTDAGIALVLEVQLGRVRIEGEGSTWLPQTTYDGQASGGGGRFALYAGGVRGCIDVLPRGTEFDLGPCAGAEVGATTGSGVGLYSWRSQSEFWGAGLLGLSLRFLALQPFAIGLLAELGAPFHRAAWQIDDIGQVFQPSPFIGRASLGLNYLFP
jgi:hypothetical protein